jgi:lipopolysaccharide biosynthesis protein
MLSSFYNLDNALLRIVAGTMFWVRFDVLKTLNAKAILELFADRFTNHYIENGGNDSIDRR